MSDIENESKNDAKHDETPEVFAVKHGDQGWEFNRREFIAVMGLSAGVIATGCIVPSLAKYKNTPTPTSSATPQPSATSTKTSTSTPTQTPTQTPTARPTIEADLCRDPLAHKDLIRFLAISEDGSQLVSASDDGTVKVWSLPGVELLNTLTDLYQPVVMAVSMDGTKLAVQDVDTSIQIYSVPDFEHLLEITYDGIITSLAFSPDGKRLVAGFQHNILEMYSAENGEYYGEYDGHEDSISCIAISPNGKYLASACVDGTIGIWSFPECELIQFLQPDSVVDEMVFSHDGKYLFSHTEESQIVQWSIPDGEIIGSLTSIEGLAINQDDSQLIFGVEYNTIQIWSLINNEPIQSIVGYNGPSKSIAISPDGSILVAGNESGSLYLWSLPVGSLFSCPVDINANPPEIEGVTYETTDSYGETVTYTLPCGAPIPDGAVCVCNCVAGSDCACVGYVSCSCDGYSACSCDTNCGCVGNVVEGSHYWYPD
jgi:WD40 repeat protein